MVDSIYLHFSTHYIILLQSLRFEKCIKKQIWKIFLQSTLYMYTVWRGQTNIVLYLCVCSIHVVNIMCD